ncbi:MAG: EF-Tu/IF-2/RF-3 family GTPase [Candidatus Methylomirabilis sp.]|nr:EF-Tu/IF-2/RF-3 family GTPase [Candidatus Methylomirabilis sp.]
MLQTREHLHICELLQVKRGVVALTKIDLVEPDWLEMVRTDLQGFLAGTFLEGAPVVAVSSVTGQGLSQLRTILRETAETIEPRCDSGIFRLPIDRVFTIKGFGTVVTGTLWSGTVRVGGEVVILPVGRRSRVRRLQVHGHTVEQAWAGQRTAVNLPGLEVDQLNRGDLLAFPDTLQPTLTLDVSLALLKDAPRALRNRTRVRFHLGTGEILARVVLLDREELNPGEEAYAHLRLEGMTVALAGDRYVIRSYSPAQTIGGGSILDPNPRSGAGPGRCCSNTSRSCRPVHRPSRSSACCCRPVRYRSCRMRSGYRPAWMRPRCSESLDNLLRAVRLWRWGPKANSDICTGKAMIVWRQRSYLV